MAISIDWPNAVINVPRADLTLVQSTPVEIRELNINNFRLTLKELEADTEGMPYLKTHTHNTEVALGGLTFARVIQILDPYTVTFEDGQYTVDLVGANSNIGDKINANQVSVRSYNSAGLISNAAIEYASFNGGVTVDVLNGVSGTIYPTGTPRQPSNNLDDALLIANYRGFTSLYIIGNAVIDNSNDFSDMSIYGESPSRSNFYISVGANTENLELYDATISGTLDGNNLIQQCHIIDLNYINGNIGNCGLAGNITLGGNTNSIFNNCYTTNMLNSPVIDMAVSGQSLIMPDFSGNLSITNLADATQEVGIGLDAGQITLTDSVTAGNFIFSGVGELINNSTSITSLTTSGLISKQTITQAVWDEPIGNHLIAGTTGKSVGVSQFGKVVTLDTGSSNSGTTFPVGTERYPVNNLSDALTIATENGITEINIKSNLTVNAGQNISGYTISSSNHSTITLSSGAIAFYTNFSLCNVEGYLNGYTILSNCSTSTNGLYNFYGIMDRCVFNGDIEISSDTSTNAVFLDCFTGNVSGPPTLDCAGDGAKVSFRGLTGALKFSNKTGTTNPIFIDIYSARVGFDSTVTAGNITVRGTGYIYLNDSTNTVFDTTGLTSQNTVANAVLGTSLVDYDDIGTVGGTMVSSSYNKGVYIDTSSTYSGIVYPVGTVGFPVNNIEDALSLSTLYSVPFFHLHSDVTITSGLTCDHIHFHSHGSFDDSVTVENGVNMHDCTFEDLKLTGTLYNRSEFENVYLENVTEIAGRLDHCIFNGTISLRDNETELTQIRNTHSASAVTFPILDVGNSPVDFINYIGLLKVQNKTESTEVSIHCTLGLIWIDNTNTEGTINIAGRARVIDESGPGCTVNTDYLYNTDVQADKIWTSITANYTTDGTLGSDIATVSDIGNLTTVSGISADIDYLKTRADENYSLLEFIRDLESGKQVLVNNQLICYAPDNTTELIRFNLFDATGSPTTDSVYKRERT